MTHCFYLILVPEILCINLNWLLENNDPKGPFLIAAMTAFWETLSEMHRKYSLYLENLSCLRKDAPNVASLCFPWAYIWFFLRLGYTSPLQIPRRAERSRKLASYWLWFLCSQSFVWYYKPALCCYENF